MVWSVGGRVYCCFVVWSIMRLMLFWIWVRFFMWFMFLLSLLIYFGWIFGCWSGLWILVVFISFGSFLFFLRGIVWSGLGYRCWSVLYGMM